MPRKTAPNVSVSARYVDDRKVVQDAWNNKDSEYVHIWQPGDISAEELNNRGMEIVKGADGNNVMHGADVLCRRSAEKFKAEQKAQADLSKKVMAKIAGSERKVTKYSGRTEQDVKEG